MDVRLCLPESEIGIEIDGRGRHQTVVGVQKDCEKLNEATVMGWRILRFPATDKSKVNEWVQTTVEALCLKESP